MPNTSNAPHVGTAGSGLSSLAVFTLLLLGSSFSCAGFAQAAAAGGGPAPGGFVMSSLRPALANVQTTIGNINVSHWKLSGAARTAVQGDIASMQRDLNGTLPGLVTQADGSGPGVLSPSFAVFRNVDALYDVLLRLSETAALAAPAADAGSLEDARAGLEDGRARLGTWLLQAIGNQDAQIARLRAAPPQPAAPPPTPTKTVIDDGPATAKPHKKKPAPAPAAPAQAPQ